MLQVHLLGRFEVRLDGEPIHLSSRPAQALLAYLLLNPEVAHPRERLAGVLWPDSSEANARSNLRQALWRLRQAIGSGYLAADRKTVSLNADADIWSDVAALQADLPDDASADAWMEALSFYGGDLLPGFYEDWVALERERLQALFGRRMQRLLQGLLQESRWDEALDWAESWIALGQVPEPAYRALMSAHAARGDMAAVADVWHRCRRDLAEELGVEPSDETRRLYERLTAAEPQVQAPPPRGAQAVPARPPDFLQAEDEPPADLFVGRQRALHWLQGHLAAALAGRGKAAFIAGGPGRGKTALLRAFAREAHRQDPDLLIAVGTCNAYAGSGDPYLPFREMLAALTGDPEHLWSAGALTADQARRLWQAAPTAIQTLLETSPALIDLLVPGRPLLHRASQGEEQPWLPRLKEIVQRNATGQPASGLQQAHVLEMVSHYLRSLSAQTPLLLMIDDLQWADSASVDLLFHLGRQLAGARILILAAYRPAEVHLETDHRRLLQGLVNELRRVHGDVLLDLREEDQLEGRAFIDALLDTEPNRLDGSFREALHQHTGGHPLFTLELLRSLQERGELTQDDEGRWVAAADLDWGTMPARVEAVIEQRIARLPEHLQRVLSVASVEGEEFTLEVLAGVQDLDEWAVLESLTQDLERRRRLVRFLGETRADGRTVSRYRFTHHLFQRYLYERLPPAARRLLHGRVAATLEALYQPAVADIANQLAYHYQRAGDHARARTYYAQAGRRAAAAFANQEAESLFRAALALDPSDEERADILAELASVLALQARFEEALDFWRRAVSVYRAHGKAERVAWCHARMARAVWSRGDAAECLRLAEEGLEIVGDAPDSPELADLLHETGRACYFNGRGDRALSLCQRSLEMAERTRAVRTQAEAMITMALSLGRDRERLEEATRLYEEAIALSRRHHLLEQEIRALNNLAHFMTESLLGDYATARQYLLHAAELARQRGAVEWRLHVEVQAAFCAIRLGNLPEAESELRDLRQRTAMMAADTRSIHHLRQIENWLQHAKGRLEQALAGTRASLEEYKEDLQLAGKEHFEIVEILLQLDRLDEAEAHLEELIAIADQGGAARPGLARTLKAILRARQGRIGEAEALLKEATRLSPPDRYPVVRADLRRAEGHLAAALRDPERVDACFGEAVALLQDLNIPQIQARLLREWARAHLAMGPAGSREKAFELLGRARSLFEKMGARDYVAAVDEEMAGLR